MILGQFLNFWFKTIDLFIFNTWQLFILRQITD